MRKKISNFTFEKFVFFLFLFALALISAKSAAAQTIMSNSSNILEIKASSTLTNSVLKFVPSTSANSFSLQGIAPGATTVSIFDYLSSTSSFKMLNGTLNYNPSNNFIGIGTVNPRSKLEVNGDILIPNGNSLLSRNSGNNVSVPLFKFDSTDALSIGTWEGSYVGNTYIKGGNGSVFVDFSQGNNANFIVRKVSGTTPTELMRVTTAGNVGIGVSPAYKLDVAYDGSGVNLTGNTIHNLGAPATGTDAANRFYVDGLVNDIVSAATYWKLDASKTKLYASSTAWNVGIGTTNPGARLSIQDSSNQGLTPSTGAPTIFADAGTNFYAAEYKGNGNYTGFYVINSKAGGTGVPYVQYWNTVNSKQWTTQLEIDNSFSVREGNAAGPIRMTYAVGGNVGIGTTAPGAFRLYVNGATYTSGNLNVGGDATITGGDVSISNNNGGINFNDASAYWLKTATNYGIYWDTTANQFKFNGAGATKASIDLDDGAAYFDGNVGIGTTAPEYKLDIAYDGSGVNLAGNTIHNLGAPGTSTDAVNRFYVDSNFAPIGGGASLWATSSAGIYNVGLGKVGIGTTGPSTALQVAGTVTATQFNGSGAGLTGTAASLTAGAVSGLTLNSSAAPIVPDNVTQNQIGYNTGFGLFGASDGGLYSSAYSSAWIHQIYGDFRTGRVAIRGKNSGTWQPWRTVLDSLSDVSSSGSLKITGAGPHYIQNGNVGIGITTPNAGLEVLSGSNYSILAGGKRVGNVAAPVSGTDAVNRSYVDTNFIASTSLATITNAFVQGGNSFGAKAILGTNDNQALGIETNNTEKMTILANGSVGIGISNPNQQLEITKNFRLPASSGANPYGVIYKGWDSFIHDFNYGLNGNGITTNGGNTFVGLNAGNLTMGSTATSTDQASYNTGIGFQSLRSNTTGYANTANGYFSLHANTTGYYNTANGYGSLLSNTTGNNNTANGVNSLHFNTTGNNNTANGYTSLYSNTTGSNNSALGNLAGTYFGSASARESGDYGLYLGYDTRASGNGMNNEIVIGALAVGHGSNTATYGNTSMTKHVFEAGNVGIGTTAPGAYKLYVNGATYTSGNLNVGGDATVSGGDVYDNSGDLHLSGEDNLYLKIDYNNDDANTRNIIFAKNTALETAPTGVNELMRITETGNVGIGLDGAAPTYKLEVKGEGNFNSSQVHGVSSPTFDTDVANQGYVKSSVEGSAFWKLSGSNVYASSTAWNVGIGVNNPGAYKLFVAGNSYLSGKVNIGKSDSYGELEILHNNNISNPDTSFYPLRIKNDSWSGNQITGIEFWNGSDKTVPTARIISQMAGDGGGGENLHFQTQTKSATNPNPNQPTTKMTITNTGKVGIGTSIPSEKLEVAGNIFMNTGYLMQTDTWGMKWKFAGDSDTVEMNSSETAWKFNIAGGGVTKYRFNSSKTGFGPILDLNASGSSIFYGNVGIGTTTPTSKLHVVGSSYLNGTIKTNLTGTGSRCLHVDASGVIGTMAGDCGTSTGGDNLGNHTATENIKLGNNWLSGDGGFEGIFVKSDGDVTIGHINGVYGNSSLNFSVNGGASIDSMGQMVLAPPGGTFDVPAPLTLNPSGGSITAGGTIYNTDASYWLRFDNTLTDSLRVQGDLNTTGILKSSGTGANYMMGRLGLGTTNPASTARVTIDTPVASSSILFRAAGADKAILSFKNGISLTMNSTIGVPIISGNTGYYNIGIGSYAIASGTGSSNIGIGVGAAQVATGGNNIAIGGSAMNSTGGGGNNIAIGSSALYGGASGNTNIAIGNNALGGGVGGGNIAIGNGGQWANSNNKLYIGDLDIASTHIPLIYGFMTGKSPNQFGMGIGTTTLGTTTAGTVALTVAGDMFATGAAFADGFYGPSAMGSDIRLKHDIKTLSEEDYRKVFKLRPVSFTYNKDNRDDYGFIAQEVQKLYPETVTNGGDGNLYIYYNSLIAPTVAAVQAQEKKIEEQETLINILLDRVNKLENSAK